MRITDRLRRLEAVTPGCQVGPFTAEQMKGVDDLTLCRYAIQETERAISSGSDCVPYDPATQHQLGVANDEELLMLLHSWLPEYEAMA